MREFKLKLKRPNETLKDAGYVKVKDYYENRIANQGRFHCTMNQYNIITCHYDVFIEGRHVVFHMPLTLKAESKRIRKIDAKNSKQAKERNTQ